MKLISDTPIISDHHIGFVTGEKKRNFTIPGIYILH